MTRSRRIGLATLICILVAASVTVYASAARTRSAASTITLGATLPLSGALGPFGPDQQKGFQQAVDEANAAGGILIGGKKQKVKLVVLDNKSDPNLAATQARTLLLSNHASALLGPISPPLAVPVANVAEQFKVPFVGTLLPTRAFLASRPSGWKYSYSYFFDETKFTTIQYRTANLVSTNKKVALFTDTEPDGVVMGGLWEAAAPKYGYTIAYHAKFPVGTTDFSTYINAAKTAGAEVLIAQMIPPDAIALWKQMKSLGWVPKTAECEKCASNGFWEASLGPIAQGTLVNDGGWSPLWNYPRTKFFVNKFVAQGGLPSVASIVLNYTVAQVVLDAMRKTGTTKAATVNTAIAATKKLYPGGPVDFAPNHTAIVKSTVVQIQGNARPEVWPQLKGSAAIVSPPPGLG